MNDRPKLNWSVIETLEEEGIAVEITRSDGYRPRYAVRVGRKGERGVIPFLPMFIKGQGKIHVVTIASTVEKLLIEAEKLVEGLAQQHEDEYIEQRIAREARQVEKEGKKRKSSGYKHGKDARR